MNSFNTQLHSDEISLYQPTAADWAEYGEHLEAEEIREQNRRANAEQDLADEAPQPESDESYVWDEEAIDWEEGFRSDNLYDY